MTVRASIIVIGDEILDGHTRDTNSGWLAGWLSARGVTLDRVVTVPDEEAAIGEALTGELGRSANRLLLTSGGIGSTPDDLTMKAVAAHLGVRLEAHPVLDERISAWAAQALEEGVAIPAGQQRAMRKMALVPHGAYLLEGVTGFTPGVALDLSGGVLHGGATLVILPGVPSELRRITEQGVEGLVAGLTRPDPVVELRHPYPESALTPLLEELVAEHPGVQIGSYPGHECVLRLKGPAPAVEVVARRLRDRLDALAGDEDAQWMSARWQAHWE